MTPNDIDFTPCEAERIDAPGAVQGYGVLLALDRETGRVTHHSRNAAEIMPDYAGMLIGLDAATLSTALELDIDLDTALGEICAQADAAGHAVQPVEIARNAAASFLLSVGARHVLLERRPEPACPQEPASTQAWLENLSEAFVADGDNVFALCQSAAERVRALVGYDRVMVYRFAADWTGEVVAESRVPDVTPYLGLHYPATDIPAQARRLYLENRLREIVDTRAATVPIEPPCAASSTDPVDLSTSVLRAISPYHLEYTNNLGVRATLVASLVVDGVLWGLIACHHRDARLAGSDERDAVRRGAEFLAASIAEAQRRTSRRGVLRVQDRLARMEQALSDGGNCADVFLDAAIIGMHADGAMLCVGPDVVAVGHAPPADMLSALGRYLTGLADNGAIAVDDLPRRCAEIDLPLDGLCGAAGVVIAGEHPLMLVAFREEFVRTVDWGGDPGRAAEVDPSSGRLSPRSSFAIWHQTVTGLSRPWGEEVRAFLAGLSANRVLERAAGRLAADIRVLRDNLAHPNALRTAMMNFARDGMTLAVAADADGVVRMVSGNRAFSKLFDLDPEACQAMPIADLVARLGVREKLSSLPADAEITVWSPALGTRTIALQRRKVLDTLIDGTRQNWELQIFQDVTQSRRRQEALAVAFEQALSEARAKAEFLANMSHELRTPLNAVLGYAEVVADAMLGPHSNPKYGEYARDIQSAGTHLLDLIDRLLTVSQIEARKRALTETRFDLAGLTVECAAWVAGQPGDPKPAISVETPSGPVEVLADSTAMRQVAINLIGNAAKFTPASGSVTVTVMFDDMGAPTLIVRDNGPGVPPDVIGELFKPFRQGEGVYARRHGGVGLGLSIVKGLVELHGGSVRMTSREGVGTEVTVLLPVSRRR